MGIDHYENFPVASVLVPAPLRPAVQAIYRFARTADDLADEGDAAPPERLAALAALGEQLERIAQGAPHDWPDLAAAVAAHRLPLPLFHDLLSAFAQDVTVKRYADYPALLDYCRRSANPIGRLLLALYGRDEPVLLEQSDAICSALQLVNFWQDVAIDWAKGRVYLPQDELAAHGLRDDDIGAQRRGPGWARLMRAQTERASAMLESGAPLAGSLGGRIGFELRLVVQGGLRIAERIDAVDGDVFRRRPTLGKADWIVMTARALRM